VAAVKSRNSLLSSMANSLTASVGAT
jgi:hypothetical protein